jgi:hypothetical protein
MDLGLCLLCGERPAVPFRDMLCEPCDQEQRSRLASKLAFGEVRDCRYRTLKAMSSLEKEFPDGTALVEEAHRALYAAFPAIDSLYREMDRQHQETDKRLRAARENAWALMHPESDPEGSE